MSDAVHVLGDEPATISEWLGRAEALHRSLRSALPDDYEGYLRRMFLEGAQMAVLHADKQPKALAVYRCRHTTFHGLRFYVDDLVTQDADRGQGRGAALLRWCEDEGSGAGMSDLRPRLGGAAIRGAPVLFPPRPDGAILRFRKEPDRAKRLTTIPANSTSRLIKRLGGADAFSRA